MDQSLYVDPDELRRVAADLRARAAETARMVAELKADLAREGECWGDDEPGRLFAESYVPESERNLTGFENLVQNIEAMSANLHTLADTFESQDRAGGAAIRNSLPDLGNPQIPALGYSPPLGAPNQFGVPSQGLSGAETGRQAIGPSATGPLPAADETPAPGRQQPAGQSPVSAPATTTGPRPGRGAGGADPNRVGSRQPSGGAQQPTSDPETSGRRAPATATAPSTATPPSRASAPGSAPASPPGSPSAAKTSAPTAPGTRSPGPNPATPATPRNSAAPWSKPGAAGQPGQPAQPGQPRPSQSRRADAAKKAQEPRQRKDSAPKPPPRPVTADEAMQIINAMAARHQLVVSGFETSGITTRSALELAETVDTVLDKYPLPLRGVAVADLGETGARVENRGTAAAPEPWIVLDRATLADPGVAAGRDRVRARPVESADHPVQAQVLRALGEVVDLQGGFRARTSVQRALITEYLRLTGAEGRTLAQVTDGYRRWRKQLGEYCFRDGVLDPGRALAQGFAGVEQRGAQAPGPAKVLHRLLLTMARLDMR